MRAWRLLPLFSLLLLSAPHSARAAAAPCAVTTETSDMVADSDGFLCAIEQLDSRSCCPKENDNGKTVELLASLCRGSCCSHYAACVHSCSHDDAARKEVVAAAQQSRFRDAWNPEKNAAPFDFDLCRDVCRTHAGTVANGNAFASDFRFCYGRYVGLPPPPLPQGVTVVAGIQAASCDDACAGQKLRCSAAALPLVNTCDLLGKHFGCKRGCFSNAGPDQPAHVVLQSDALFDKCLTNGDAQVFSCGGKHASTRRLCPCV